MPHTDRGSALLYNDGAREVVVEDLGDLRFPKGKALPPEGQVPELGHDPLPEPVEDNPQHRLEHLDREISFPVEKHYTTVRPELSLHGCTGTLGTRHRVN